MASITYDEAAHLLRRMGFGGSPEEINDLVGRGREGAVDYLINHDQVDNSELRALLDRGFDFSDPDDFPKFNRFELQRWWFTRMAYTRGPFEEKMVLFWHNHFATSNNKVEDDLMYIQNRTLRKHALDRFDKMVLEIAKDPAMLVWLDGVTNVRESPNENFARELQELFTMGIHDVVTGQPNYSEQDVQEIARAFTGWTFDGPGERDPDRFNFKFYINEDEHDNGTKTVYGQTANFSGEDVITVICARRATARFLVKRLFDFFVYPLTGSDADKATVEKFADVYMSRDHSVRALVRAIFTSDEFFSSRARFALVKQPVELVVGAVRMLGARYNPGTYEEEKGSNILGFASTFLGQELLNPPDVSGWNLGLDWINTASLLNRYTWADYIAISRPERIEAPGVWLPHDQVARYTKKTADKTVKNFLKILGPLRVDPETNQALIHYLESDDQGNPVRFKKSAETIDRKVRGLVHLMMCLSEFQLN